MGLVAQLLDNAIDARSPRKRPPGKAGLRAEKGYFRLLYLQDQFATATAFNAQPSSTDAVSAWGPLQAMLDQLADIPELQAELADGIEAALESVAPADR